MRHPLIPTEIFERLRANAEAGPDADPVPVLKLFNPVGAGTWILTEIQPDDDTLFGLCDLEMGCPELGYVSLAEISGVRLPFGLAIERDLHFQGRMPLSAWADAARRTGSIREAEAILRQGAPASDPEHDPAA
jgi:hypothetical protein